MNKRQLSPEEHLLIVQRAKKRLIDFQIASNPRYEANWHHELIARELEHISQVGDRDYKVLMLFVPPRHGKSQQGTIDFPAWFLGNNPGKEIITASYSGELAQDFGTKTREKVESAEYRAIFDTKLKEDERSKGRWRTVEGGAYTSLGVGGAATGRGANVLIIDDPIKNREEAASEVFRNKTWDWFTSTAFTRLEPSGVVIVILTRWHQDDLAGRILSHPHLSKRCKVMKFPAIADYDDAYRKQGEPLWPAKYDGHALDEIRTTIGPYDWAALYQQTPILSENQEFKAEWFRPISEHELGFMSTRNFLSVDTAMSKRAQADSTGFVDNSVNDQNFWHFRAWRAKLGPEELVQSLFALHQRRSYEKIGIEKTAYLEGLKPYLDAEMRKRNVFLPIVELQHSQTAKEVRVRGLIPRYAGGSVFHVSGQCGPLEDELIAFPFGAHDDVADAAAYQSQLAEAPDAGVAEDFGLYGSTFT